MKILSLLVNTAGAYVYVPAICYKEYFETNKNIHFDFFILLREFPRDTLCRLCSRQYFLILLKESSAFFVFC